MFFGKGEYFLIVVDFDNLVFWINYFWCCEINFFVIGVKVEDCIVYGNIGCWIFIVIVFGDYFFWDVGEIDFRVVDWIIKCWFYFCCGWCVLIKYGWFNNYWSGVWLICFVCGL